MHRFDKHISSLLYDHECVIVPQLGGFLTSYTPAEIHSSRRSVIPPSKKIAFNVYLKHNDGLLANYIVQTESLTYPEALKEIGNYVADCNSQLAAGKKVVISQVGVLTKDQETNIQFEPFKNVNYLKDSFGLSPVQLIPVINTEFEQEVQKQLRDFISIRPSQPQPRQLVTRKRIRLNSLNTTLLTGSILWLFLNLYIVAPDNLNIASLNPFKVRVEKTLPAPPPVQPSEPVYTQPAEPVNAAPAADPSAFEEAIGKKIIAHKYFIVAGAFSSESNAAKLQAELKTKGFSNAQVIENDGLSLVCYEGFQSLEEAAASLNHVKKNYPEAWIFSR